MSNGVIILLVVAGVIVLFLVLREFNTWYWKINDMLKTLQSIDSKLNKIVPQNSFTKDSQMWNKSKAEELEREHNRTHPKKDWSNLKPKKD